MQIRYGIHSPGVGVDGRKEGLFWLQQRFFWLPCWLTKNVHWIRNHNSRSPSTKALCIKISFFRAIYWKAHVSCDHEYWLSLLTDWLGFLYPQQIPRLRNRANFKDFGVERPSQIDPGFWMPLRHRVFCSTARSIHGSHPDRGPACQVWVEDSSEANQLRESWQWQPRSSGVRGRQLGGDSGLHVSAAEHDLCNSGKSINCGRSAIVVFPVRAFSAEINQSETWVARLWLPAVREQTKIYLFTEDSSQAYSRLDSGNKSTRPSLPKRTSMWLLNKASSSMSTQGLSKSISKLNKPGPKEEVEKEWLLLGEASSPMNQPANGPENAESSILSDATTSDIECIVKADNSESESDEDIDSIVEEFQQKVKVSTAGLKDANLKVPSLTSWRLALLCIVMIFGSCITAAVSASYELTIPMSLSVAGKLHRNGSWWLH